MAVQANNLIDPQRLAKAQDALRRYGKTVEEYPWHNLEGQYESGVAVARHLIGYGSLLHPDSARKTVPNTPPKGHMPVIAFGARRVFDYVIPDNVLINWGVAEKELSGMHDRAALNAHYTGRSLDIITGRLVPLNAKDLPALREREKAYDLRVVPYVPYASPNEAIKLAYILCATPRPWNGQTFVDRRIKPFQPYLSLCRSGVAKVSKEYLELFNQTTCVADGKTSLKECGL